MVRLRQQHLGEITLAAEVGGQVAGEQVGGSADQGEGATDDRGKGEGLMPRRWHQLWITGSRIATIGVLGIRPERGAITRASKAISWGGRADAG